MDRLSIVVILVAFAWLLGACGDEKKSSSGQSAAAPPSRTVGVAAKGNGEVPLAEFCDVTAANPPKKLRMPETDTPPPTGKGAKWVNVWATWCKPCIKEMPMLASWRERFAKDGVDMRLDFLSVDEEAAALTSFMKKNPQLPASLHLKDPDALEPWIQEIGLDPGGGLPIHIFTDKNGAIRCIRAGAIHEDHYPTIAGLLR